MDAFILKFPDFKLLGKTKFLKLTAEEGINKKIASEYYEKRELNQIYNKVKPPDDYHITAPPYSFQIDIIELPKYKTTNNGIYKILLIIDIISRKGFAYPLKNGTMEEVLYEYENFIKDNGGDILNSVAGDDFFNNEMFQTYNEELDIRVITNVAKDDHLTEQGNKLGIIDRFTRTLKMYIQKYMLEYKTTKWTSFLNKLIDLYNDTPHGAFKNHSTPNEVYDDEEYSKKLFEGQRRKNNKIVNEFSSGDQVRLLLGKSKFEKEKARYSTEIYTVFQKIGYRLQIENVKRLYRPSELLMVKDVTDRIDKKEKDDVEVLQTKINKVSKELNISNKEAHQNLITLPEGKISSRLKEKKKINYLK